MEKIVEQGLLYDFYGELLTEHQKQIYEDAVFQDMSLSELAEEHGISRQGVHDLIKRCDKQLKAYEDKLGLLERFSRIKKMVEEIERQTLQEEVRRLANQILEEL
ncbi:MAG: YlxM family DNA-binding protein [Lachnospiraceae bacterium]